MSKHDVISKNLSDMNNVLWANGIYNRKDMEWYSKFNRFGLKDPYNALTGHTEYLFFTKPDLHIVNHNTGNLNPELENQPYFVELRQRYPAVITQLQLHNGLGKEVKDAVNSPFMTILSNSVKNTLDLPNIAANTIDTSATMYGTAYNYRGWGYKSDEIHEFSLEFEDTKYLEIYNLIKAYEEYERLKHMGLVTPPNFTNERVTESGKCFSYYIKNKILHDQFAIYKFIVEDDGETIIHYSKLWGVFFKNVPRETFSDLKEEGGITYAVEFEAAFVDDMNPTILADFNELVYSYVRNNTTKDLPIYSTKNRMIDGSWAKFPIIQKAYTKDLKWNGPKTMQHVYKLKWRV